MLVDAIRAETWRLAQNRATVFWTVGFLPIVGLAMGILGNLFLKANANTITVNGTATASPGHSANVQLQVAVGVPGAPALAAPADNASGVARTPAFSWAADPAAIGYTIEVATDSAFATIVASGTSNTNSWTPGTALAAMTTYYWRVRSNSPCGNSANSSTFTFTTASVTSTRSPMALMRLSTMVR